MRFQHRLVHRGRFLEEREEPKEAKATDDLRKCMVGGCMALHTPIRRGQRDWEGKEDPRQLEGKQLGTGDAGNNEGSEPQVQAPSCSHSTFSHVVFTHHSYGHS